MCSHSVILHLFISKINSVIVSVCWDSFYHYLVRCYVLTLFDPELFPSCKTDLFVSMQFIGFHLFTLIIFIPSWPSRTGGQTECQWFGGSKKTSGKQVQRESKGNTTNKSIINDQKSRFPPHLSSSSLTSWFIFDWTVEIMQYLFPHLTNTVQRQTDRSRNALQDADQGKLTSFILHG